MTTARAGMRGAAPAAKIEKAQHAISGDDVRKIIGDEKVKYLRCWDHPDYRKWSPGEQCVDLFLETAEPEEGETLVDWGCGTGRASKKLWENGLDVTLVDFAANCLDDEVKEVVDRGDCIRFIEHDLSEPIALKSDYGYCCDVMEHIPPEDVEKVLRTILENSLHVFLQISTVEDHFSKVIDDVDHLHLTVKPYSWWLQKFADFGCIVHHSNEFASHCIFYVTGHRTFIFNRGQVNTDPDTVIANMRANAETEIPQLLPHEAQEDLEIMLLAGGPSLNDYWDEIIEQREAGMPLVTTNGTYNQCVERGLKPSLQFVIDAREFNKRFVEPIVDDCKYIVASQCHPDLVKSLPVDRSYLWQVTLEDSFFPVIEELWGKPYVDWFPCPGGSTVTLRAICALQMMGFRKLHIYGFDSCMREDEHHAYEQAENDDCPLMDLRIGRGTPYDRTFKCQGWMGVQAKEFEQLTRVYFQDMKLDVKGDGAIAHIIKSSGEIELDD